jgi:hypothetical protein
MTRLIGPLTWAWIIIIGFLMLSPRGITCIACGGDTGTKIVGIVSIALGIVGMARYKYAARRSSRAR